SPGVPVLPLLRFVARNGNTSVFRWRTGLEPLRLERPRLREEPEPPREDTVGWDLGSGEVFGVPWGDAGLDLGSQFPRGVWGGTGVGFGLWGGFWGAGFCSPRADALSSRPTAAPEAVARGSDALTLLENPETRNQFLDELMELELFLAQRLLELEDEADVVAMSQLQLAPAVLQGQSGQRLRALLATARDLLGQLCSPSVQHLCMILASPRC
ncbi:CK5P3 protein, partial [Poecile atricapillus]|nr:CK5P3 protein [Poecile atricapillus]